MKQRPEQGNILIVALIMIVVVSGFVAVSVNATNGAARLADRSRDYIAAQAAAEGAIEDAYGLWKKRISNQNQAISSSAASANLNSLSFPGFAFASSAEDGRLQVDALDQYGAPVANATPVTVDVVGYPGWRGRTYTYVARGKVVMNPATYNFRAGVKRLFQYSEVPLFQAMFFFEHDIEFYKPAEMIVGGLVHTNSMAYLSGQKAVPLTFLEQVSYVKGYTDSSDPPYSDLWSGWSPNATVSPVYPSGMASQVHQVARMEPLGSDADAVIDTTDANPNNDGMRELIEPPVTGFTDPPEFAKRRLYNKAGIVIEINGPVVTATGQNGLNLNPAKQTLIRNAITNRTTIYDQREGKNVDVVTLDMVKLNTALGSGGMSNFNNVLYIYDATPITPLTPNPKTVRLSNGGVLPADGLTVASGNPVYIQGDYNTGTTTDSNLVPSNSAGNPGNTKSPTVPGYERKPASVIGDAVMFLSNSWNDANSSLALTSRPASHTTYNTAIVSGFMPSGWQPPVGAQYGYSGGANNFPRFLEQWSGQYCTYYGSMVELFQSKTFAGKWDTGVIYRPPLRCWNFDTNFRDTPPPGSLDAASFSRGTWAKY